MIKSCRDLDVWQKAMDLVIACGSLAEVETHIQIAGRLGYVDEKQVDKILDKTEVSLEKKSA